MQQKQHARQADLEPFQERSKIATLDRETQAEQKTEQAAGTTATAARQRRREMR